jgi:hypothetical protein
MARPTEAELEALRKKYPDQFGPDGRPVRAPSAAAPAPVVAPQPERRPKVEAQKARAEAGETLLGVGHAEDELTRAFLEEVRREAEQGGAPLSGEAMRVEARARAAAKAAEAAPPMFMGGFTPTAYTAPAVAPGLPLAPPQEVPREKPAGMAEALAPQTRVGTAAAERIKREQAAGLFDDVAFNKSIAGMGDTEKREALDAYEAYKAAFKRVRELNPPDTGVTDEDIKRDLDRQIKALESGEIRTIVDDPANRMGYSGDPLARALQRQVTTGAVPMLEPGALTFVETLDRVKRDRRKSEGASAAESRLRTQGVEIMRTEKRATGERGPGGRPVMEDVQVGTGQFRPATEAEIAEAKKNVAAYEEKADELPFYLKSSRDTVLRDIEGAAKDGTVFQKEYPTGATVESPVSWFVRSAMAVPNALVGTVSEAFTPDVIGERERAARPELYKGSSAAVYNVAGSRGLMGEIGDLYEYAPETWTINGTPIKEYATYAKAAGFAGDIIGFDLGLIGGAVTGARTAAGVARGARAVGAPAARVATKQGLKAASAEFLDTIGLTSAAKAVPLGDVRLGFGVSMGDSYRAAETYLRSMDEQEAMARAAGAVFDPDAAHAVALTTAERRAPRSKFLDDADRAGPAIERDVRSGKYFGKAPEWDEYRKVMSAVDELRNPLAGGARAPRVAAAAQALRPYIAGATKYVPEVADLFESGRLVVGQRVPINDFFDAVRQLPADAQTRFYDFVEDVASAEKGFTTIDRATKGIDPGRFTIRLTPTTFTTERNADKILEGVRQTPEYQMVNVIADRKLYRGLYPLTVDETQRMYQTITREATTGSLPRSVAESMRKSLMEGGLSPEHLRQLLFSVTDGVAADTRLGFRSRALAETGMRDVRGRGQVPVPSRRVEVGAEVGVINSALRKSWSKVMDAVRKPTDLRNLLSPDQVRIIEDGRRAIGAIPARLAVAMKQAEGATNAQKLIGLALRTKPGTPMGAFRNIEFWNDVARSAIFGQSDRSVMELLMNDFTYSDALAILTKSGRDQLFALSAKYKDLTAAANGLDEVEALVPKFIDEARTIVSSSENLTESFMEKGGLVFDLRSKPEEVLVATWARKESAAIHDETIARVLDFEPDTVGALNAAFAAGLKGAKDANGMLLAGRPLDILVAEAMRPGGTVVTSVDDMIALPAMKAWIDDVDRVFGNPGFSEQMLRMFGGNIMADVAPTVAAVQGRYMSYPAEAMVRDMESLMRGEATLSEVGSPIGALLGKALAKELGDEMKYAEMLKELGQLAEIEAKGSAAVPGAMKGLTTAVGLRRAMSNLLSTGNSFFYNMVLYVNPRYHGINFITAPTIGYSTTGRVLTPDTLMLMTGTKTMEAVGGLERMRDVVITTDRLGVPYTYGQLFDAAVQRGAFKSQAAANIDPRFLEEARKLGIGTGLLGKGSVSTAEKAARNLVSIPSEVAQASDNFWRMSYMVDALKQGKTLDEALDVGRVSLYDYGAATDFERKYIARQILFYNFFRNSVFQTFRQMAVAPSRFVRMARFTQDVTRLNVGESNWEDMRFYTPYDAGISRIVTKFAPQANREGKITLLPQMPYYDAVYLMSGMMTMPLNLVAGAKDPRTGQRLPGTSYILQKLSPQTQMLIGTVAGLGFTYDIKMKQNIMPVQHVAIADDLGLLPVLTSMYNVKARPAKPGEAGYNGMVYEMTPDGFKAYQETMKDMRLLGVQRPFEDFGKIAASLGLYGATGPAEQAMVSGPEAVGFTTETGAGLPIEAEVRAGEIRQDVLQQQVRQKETETGVRRPKERR